ncbi:synapsin-1-like, partial [Scyliorhinus canicula]|uniref:synapsin-1-like n=1 Tax=Scyliorhinus canicula TaxID=7830 RepID=UPI0018F50F6B
SHRVKVFKGKKVWGEFDLKVEQAEFAELNVISQATGTFTVDMEVYRNGVKVARSFSPDFVLVRQHAYSMAKGGDFRNIVIGLQYGGVASVNSMHSVYNFCDKPWVFGQLAKIYKKLGPEEFPLIEQVFYPNHREMFALTADLDSFLGAAERTDFHCSLPTYYLCYICQLQLMSDMVFLSVTQVMDSAMPLIGEHQEEDKQLIADLVVAKMSQVLSRTPIPSPVRPTATQQPQISPQPMPAQAPGRQSPGLQQGPLPQQRPPPQGGPQQPAGHQPQRQGPPSHQRPPPQGQQIQGLSPQSGSPSSHQQRAVSPTAQPPPPIQRQLSPVGQPAQQQQQQRQGPPQQARAPNQPSPQQQRHASGGQGSPQMPRQPAGPVGQHSPQHQRQPGPGAQQQPQQQRQASTGPQQLAKPPGPTPGQPHRQTGPGSQQAQHARQPGQGGPQRQGGPGGQQPPRQPQAAPPQQRGPGQQQQSRQVPPTTQQPRPVVQGQQGQGPMGPGQQQGRPSIQQKPPILQKAPQQDAPAPHPQMNKSQSLTNTFNIPETLLPRTSLSHDEVKAETIRNLRKSFASLFSD